MLNAIVWHSQKHRFTTEEQSLPVRDVFYLLGLESSRNQEVIKSAIRTLVSTIIEWNSLEADRAQGWGVCTFLSSGKLTSGALKYRLNPEIIEQVNHPTLFAKIQLLIQSKVKKRHALVMYEFFIDALSRMKKDSLRLVVELEKLHPMLGTENTPFKFFNRDVLKPSVKEIQKHTDLDVRFETVKKGRRINEIVFFISKKEMFQTSINFDDNEDDSTLSTLGIKQSLEVLKEQGLNISIAKELANQFDYEHIIANIAYTETQVIKGKINNKNAFLVKSIKENYSASELSNEQSYSGITREEIENKARRGESYSEAAERIKK
ncbi:replication initiation protein, partial [Bathymodiolus japonicus methanotrophic gill symbiont]|uniref:replication initiation protein n=1 Tax=Bathymodiolus japonicus methanotrophic gill symbiont TaxID=113269 RepID=UPI001E35541F